MYPLSIYCTACFIVVFLRRKKSRIFENFNESGYFFSFVGIILLWMSLYKENKHIPLNTSNFPLGMTKIYGSSNFYAPTQKILNHSGWYFKAMKITPLVNYVSLIVLKIVYYLTYITDTSALILVWTEQILFNKMCYF